MPVLLYRRNYLIRHADDPERFQGLVTCATLDEISLVPAEPANPHARVTHRHAAPPIAPLLETMGETNALLVKGVGVLQQLAQLLRQSCQERQHDAIVAQPQAPLVHRPTAFTQLVQEINHAHPC